MGHRNHWIPRHVHWTPQRHSATSFRNVIPQRHSMPMNTAADSADAWTNVHDLALIFIALAYGADAELTDREIESVTAALGRWRPDDDSETVREAVVEAMAIFDDDSGSEEVIQAIQALSSKLDAAGKLRALEDVMSIAEADGLLLRSERALISVIATAWDLKAAESELLAKTTATVDDRPLWTLLHDMALLAIAVAHASTGDLNKQEIADLIKRLGGWRSELDEEDVREVIRTALETYSGASMREGLQHSAASIRERLPHALRLIVLDDLISVAESDGAMNASERDMIGTLAQAWQLGMRVSA
ncbi:TerB family tellurite resistance protein [Rhodothermus sp. AH-315-K08]|nr:TerB family tellurite resistance protein [Rhodothermus sp. AH-315-K08]